MNGLPAGRPARPNALEHRAWAVRVVGEPCRLRRQVVPDVTVSDPLRRAGARIRASGDVPQRPRRSRAYPGQPEPPSRPSTGSRPPSDPGGPPPSSAISDIADDGDDLARKFDRDFADANAAMTDSEVAALRAWQRPGRAYEPVQRLVRDGVGIRASNALATQIESATRRGQLRSDVVLWRGIRSSLETFGVHADRLSDLIGKPLPTSGFFSATVSRAVALREFTEPPLRGEAVLMMVKARRGLHAAWVAAVGDPAMRYQGELLFGTRRVVTLRSVSYAGRVPLVVVEVS